MTEHIPAQIDEITASWLGEILVGDAGGVTDLSAEALGEGVGILGQLARLTIEYADGVDGPATVIAKCQSVAPENQFLGQMMGFYLREVNFYREVATDLPIRVPHAYHADCGEDGTPFILVLEDIAGAHCPDQIGGITVDQTRQILGQVAALHAEFWESPRLEEMTW